MNLKDCLKKQTIIYKLYNIKNGFWKKGLIVQMSEHNVLINGIQVSQTGKNNYLYIGKGVRIYDCSLNIYGNNNVIYIGDKCSLRGTNFHIEDDNNEIHIGSHTTTTDKVILSAIEGTKIDIGEDCMFSTDIYVSTGDGHAVCDCNGSRTNRSQDITIGNHVWVGTRVTIGKGLRIGENSIIGAGGVLYGTQVNDEKSVVIGGNPAKILKRDINWKRER